MVYHDHVLDLDAYAADCRLFGRVELGERRLTDELNAIPELRIADARLESLEDGHVVEAGEVTVTTDELYAVVATGPRGEPARRLRTHARRVVVNLGPYTVVGMAHGTPASDPLSAAIRRAPWLPLTDAQISYRRGPDAVTDEAETLLVNRTLATSFRAVEEEVVLLPWEAQRLPRPETPRAVDLTGTLGDDGLPNPADSEPGRGPEPTV